MIIKIKLVEHLKIDFPLLYYGMTGQHVSKLQQLLKAKNIYSGKINGFYDDKTREAVINFKKKLNLRAT